ncbi:MAG: hypothetical protein R3A48_02020 [Polyangiales bacterium]
MKGDALRSTLWRWAFLGLSACSSAAPPSAPPVDAASVADDVALVDAGPRCGPGQVVCGEACASVDVDPSNCGACGARCGDIERCVAGACVATCPSGLVPCEADGGARCVSLATEAAHCGACGASCAPGEVCSAGRCALSCAAPLSLCAGGDGGVAGCAELQRDPRHCGACGRACAAGQDCVDGACALRCAAGLTACAGGDGGVGACVDTARDDAHCGACGAACPAGQRCTSGRCDVLCPAGQTRCREGCRDLQVDAVHCGACGASCREGERCEAGVCRLSCPPGQAACGGACRDLASDEAHCGACDVACGLDERCEMGRCALVCASGYTACGGRCTSLTTDPENCAACGRRCEVAPHAVAVCAAGSCGSTCEAGFADCDRDAGNGCETPLGTPDACAACGDRCGPYPHGAAVCAAGACEYRCEAGFADCDGERSNGCEVALGASCTVGQGACARPGVTGCVAGAGGCVGEAGAPAEETCNNVDDDCDGAVDEGLTQACYTGPTGTSGVGLCRPGTQTCVAGSWSTSCAGQVTPSPEVCGNTADEDCSGAADNGCTGNGSSCQSAILVTGTATFSRTTCTTAGSSIVDTSCNSGASPEHIYVVRLTRSATVTVRVTGFAIGTDEGDILYRGTSCPGASVSCTQHNTDLRLNLAAGSHYFAIEDDHGQCQSYTVTFTVL